MADTKISALPSATPQSGDQFPFVRAGTTSRGDVATFLIASNNLSDVTAATARTNLGFPLAGYILQVQSTTKTDTFSTASTTFTDVTGLSVSITPSSATSKILVIWNVATSNSTDEQLNHLQLKRDATAISVGDAAGSRDQATAAVLGRAAAGQATAGSYLDSPSTTSATTYKIQIRAIGNTATVNAAGNDTDVANRARLASTITVMEIAG